MVVNMWVLICGSEHVGFNLWVCELEKLTNSVDPMPKNRINGDRGTNLRQWRSEMEKW